MQSNEHTLISLSPVRRERMRRGLTLRDVARATGIAPPDLSQLERGLRPEFPGWRRRLAAFYHVPVPALFVGTERK
jgi:transcriptional regulator with XRE-family HTH domain